MELCVQRMCWCCVQKKVRTRRKRRNLAQQISGFIPNEAKLESDSVVEGGAVVKTNSLPIANAAIDVCQSINSACEAGVVNSGASDRVTENFADRGLDISGVLSSNLTGSESVATFSDLPLANGKGVTNVFSVQTLCFCDL